MELIGEIIQAPNIPTSAAAVQKPREGWSPPYVGWVQGQFLARRMCKFQSVTDPYLSELLALREAASLAIQKGWQKVLVETDCLIIRDEWKDGSFRSTGGHILN
jgi:hypothetical protein